MQKRFWSLCRNGHSVPPAFCATCALTAASFQTVTSRKRTLLCVPVMPLMEIRLVCTTVVWTSCEVLWNISCCSVDPLWLLALFLWLSTEEDCVRVSGDPQMRMLQFKNRKIPEIKCYKIVYSTRKAEALNSLLMKTTAKENNINDILQTFLTDHKNLQQDHCSSICNALMMITGVIETFAKCRYRFHWPWFSL